MPQTIQKNIRVTPEQWNRIEKSARERDISPNQLVINLVMEALEHGEWPRTEAEIRVARASLFTAQAIARDLISAGREGGGCPRDPKVDFSHRAGARSIISDGE